MWCMEENRCRKMRHDVCDLGVEALKQPLAHGANEYGGAPV